LSPPVQAGFFFAQGRKMKDSRLSEQVRTFIVKSIACFDTPSVIVAAVRSEFGDEITHQAVNHYDPTKAAGARMDKKWRQLFEETRKAFLEEFGTIGVSHRAVRMRKLQAEVELLEQRGHPMAVAHLLKQAAEEMGAVYTNRRELMGNSGGPIEVKDVSDRELAKAVAEILADGLDESRD
jgi:hypothetical protein